MCIQGRIRYVVGNICIKTSFGHWTGARSVDGRIGRVFKIRIFFCTIYDRIINVSCASLTPLGVI